MEEGNLIQIREAFVEEIHELLSKAEVKLDEACLKITCTPQLEKLIKLRNEFLELAESGYSSRIKFGIKKVKMKNNKGVYESFELEKEFMIDELLSANNFQVNRSIKLTERNGIVRDIKINNFQISVYLGDNRVEKKTIIKIY